MTYANHHRYQRLTQSRLLWVFGIACSVATLRACAENVLDLKANQFIYTYIAVPAVLLFVIALYKFLRSFAINKLLALFIALLLPIAGLLYPFVTGKYDRYCAERNPQSFYYQPGKGHAIVPCFQNK